jgi:hypothetical protein
MTFNRLRRIVGSLLLAFALVIGAASAASAITIHDLVALSQAGLSDAVLVALIQSDQTIYGVTPAQLIVLQSAGVSEPVILALVRNGRQPPPAPPAPAPVAAAAAPAADNGVVIVGDHPAPPPDNAVETAPSVVVVPAPIFYPVIVQPHRRLAANGTTLRPTGPTAYVGFGQYVPFGFSTGEPILSHSITVNGIRIVTPGVTSIRFGGQR